MVIVIIFSCFSVYAQAQEGMKWAIGIEGERSFEIRCIDPQLPFLPISLKGEYYKDFTSTGLKACWYFSAPDSQELGGQGLGIFLGLEGDAISFKNEKIEGSGNFYQITIGAEYFFGNFSIWTDIGPAYLVLKDKKDVQVSEIDIVVNLGTRFYF